MGALIYIVGAFALIRFAISPTYRAKTKERWKRTPTHRVVFEVGGGVLGLVILGAIVTVIIVSSR